jgi:hypothetical protein
MTVPFMSSKPWGLLGDTNFTVGSLNVWVDEPLVAPANVSTTVTLLVEACGGMDTEFSWPLPISYSPVMDAALQAGAEPFNVCAIREAVIGGDFIVKDPVIAASMCVGEKVSSFRTLLKTASLINPTATVGANKNLVIVPFGYNTSFAPAAPNLGFTSNDIYGMLCSIFLYSRGSVRIHLQPKNNLLANRSDNSQTCTITPTFVTNTGAARPGVYIYQAQNSYGENTINKSALFGPKIIGRVVDGQPVQFTVPQYQHTICRSNVTSGMNTLGTYQYSAGFMNSRTLINVGLSGVSDTNQYYNIYRSGGDDCNFGYFVSIPAMTSVNGGDT